MLYVCVSLSCSRLCHVWNPQRVCSCVVTFDAHEALSGCNHLGCIATMPIASCIPFPFSTPCDDMLTMLVCVTRWLSMHLYTLAYMSMHEPCLLVCHPYFNTVKLWTFDLNLHLSSCEHHILFVFLLVCLLAYTLAFLLCLPCLSRLSALCLFHMLCAPFSYIACLLVSCICHCMYTYGVRTYRAKAGSPRHKQKGKDESMSIWAKRLQSIGLGV